MVVGIRSAWVKTPLKVLTGLALGASVTFALFYSSDGAVPTIYAAVITPEEPPTSVVWTNLDRHPEYFRERRNAVRQVEKSEIPPFEDAWMWTAKNPNEWGEVHYVLPVEPGGKTRYATLTAPVAVHLLVDPLSRVEMWLRSESRPDWERVMFQHADTEFLLVSPELNVTSWLQGSDALEVKFRLLGSRVLAHPDPDSLIGPAGAQAMRCAVGGEMKSLELKIWFDEASD